MKRLFALGIVALVVGVVATSAMGHAPGTKYFVGTGDRHHAVVAFRVAKDKVKDAIVDGKRLSCGKRDFDTFFYNFPKTPLDGNEFRDKRSSTKEGNSLWAGHVRGSTANGRLKLRTDGAATGICKTGPIRWEAERTSKKEWQKASGFRPDSQTSADRASDLTAEISNITVNPDHLIRAKNRVPVVVEIRAEGATHARCRIDTERPKECLDGHTYKRVAPGTHTISLKAWDGPGEPATDSASFKVPRKSG